MKRYFYVCFEFSSMKTKHTTSFITFDCIGYFSLAQFQHNVAPFYLDANDKFETFRVTYVLELSELDYINFIKK